MTKFTKYDSADYLDSDEAVEAYIDEALKVDNSRLLDYAFDVVTRVNGLSKAEALLMLAKNKQSTQV